MEENKKIADDKAIVLFDGVCNLCSGSVQFILKRDPEAYFRFASLQSKIGVELLAQYGIDRLTHDSIILIEKGKAYTRSDAALGISRKLSRGWPILYGFKIVPRFIRDGIYKWIARNRYRWFGKTESCMIPDANWKKRFLDMT